MVLLKLPVSWVMPVVILGGAATLASTGVYLVRGLRAVAASGFDRPQHH
jgi:hypothetical protein